MPHLFSRENLQELIGIDVGLNAVHLLELRKIKNQYILGALATAIFTNDPKESDNVSLISKALNKVIIETKPKSTAAAIALSHSAVIKKVIDLNFQLNAAELENFLNLNIEKYIGLPAKNISFDYNILKSLSSGNNHSMRIQITAVRRERTNKCIAILQNINLQPTIIDINSAAIIRTIQHCFPNLNPATISLNIDFGSILLCSLDDAQLPNFYAHEDFINDEHLQSIPQICQQIEKNLQLYLTTSNKPIEQIILSGSKILTFPELAEAITSNTKIPTTIANPFHNMELATNLDPNLVAAEAPSMLVAYGLALRQGGNAYGRY